MGDCVREAKAEVVADPVTDSLFCSPVLRLCYEDGISRQSKCWIQESKLKNLYCKETLVDNLRQILVGWCALTEARCIARRLALA